MALLTGAEERDSIAPDCDLAWKFDSVGVDVVPAQQSVDVFAMSSGRGTRLELETAIQNRSSSRGYVGPAYDGALWLARPSLRKDGSIHAWVCWDRKGFLWEEIIIGPAGAVLTPAYAAGIVAIFATYGQSLARGATQKDDAAAYTTSAVDSGNAMMLMSNLRINPYLPMGYPLGSTTDLKHTLHPPTGETHLGALALRMLASMERAGSKIPGIYWTVAAGGHSMRDLGEDAEPHLPKGKIGGFWQDFVRALNFSRHETASAGKAPAMMPMIFIHGEEDSGYPGLNAAEYCSGLSQLADLFNADLRRVHNWSNKAPDLPIILIQCKRTPLWLYSASSRIYKRGVDGPMLAQWAAQYRDSRLVLAGPNYHLPAARDGSHLTPAGYFRLGEQIARQMWACTFGTGPLRFSPYAVTRQSSMIIDIFFKIPSGSLSLDTTNVADAVDRGKGFVCWDNNTNAGLTISNVDVQSSNIVRITLAAKPPDGAELWIDYALWGDSRALSSQSSAGPRGNLRTDTAYPSLLSSYGGPPTIDYDWCPAFRIPVIFWTGTPATWMLDGRL